METMNFPLHPTEIAEITAIPTKIPMKF